MDQLLHIVAMWFGLETDTMVLLLGVIVAVSNLIGKLIPDSATGTLGIVRKVFTVLGLYVGNRVTSGVSTNDVARGIAAGVPDEIIKHASRELPEAVRTGQAAGELATAILDSARGLEPGRRFEDGVSPDQGSRVPDEFRTDPFKSAAAAVAARESGRNDDA